MATDFKSIPLINISPLVEKWDDPNMAQDKGVAEVVRQLDRACREAGFFYVEGHGIPNSLINEIRSISRRFFHLPYDEKLEVKLSAATGYRGYQRVGENITKGVPDMHEAIDVINSVPCQLSNSYGIRKQGTLAYHLGVVYELSSLITSLCCPRIVEGCANLGVNNILQAVTLLSMTTNLWEKTHKFIKREEQDKFKADIEMLKQLANQLGISLRNCDKASIEKLEEEITLKTKKLQKTLKLELVKKKLEKKLLELNEDNLDDDDLDEDDDELDEEYHLSVPVLLRKKK
ncbi:hypothetical protein OROMI_028783 [Orobanche minor]